MWRVGCPGACGRRAREKGNPEWGCPTQGGRCWLYIAPRQRKPSSLSMRCLGHPRQTTTLGCFTRSKTPASTTGGSGDGGRLRLRVVWTRHRRLTLDRHSQPRSGKKAPRTGSGSPARFVELSAPSSGREGETPVSPSRHSRRLSLPSSPEPPLALVNVGERLARPRVAVCGGGCRRHPVLGRRMPPCFGQDTHSQHNPPCEGQPPRGLLFYRALRPQASKSLLKAASTCVHNNIFKFILFTSLQPASSSRSPCSVHELRTITSLLFPATSPREENPERKMHNNAVCPCPRIILEIVAVHAR